MKRLLFILTIAMVAVSSLHAAQISETAAHLVADRFFSSNPTRLTVQSGQMTTRLVYTAEQGHFYVFDRGVNGGFVVVAGDDRLPQVLGYGTSGDFSEDNLPPALRYWMDEMNREIAFLQSHPDVMVYQPVKRAAVVGPLMTTEWDQDEPYNDLCPYYYNSKDRKSVV